MVYMFLVFKSEKTDQELLCGGQPRKYRRGGGEKMNQKQKSVFTKPSPLFLKQTETSLRRALR